MSCLVSVSHIKSGESHKVHNRRYNYSFELTPFVPRWNIDSGILVKTFGTWKEQYVWQQVTMKTFSKPLAQGSWKIYTLHLSLITYHFFICHKWTARISNKWISEEESVSSIYYNILSCQVLYKFLDIWLHALRLWYLLQCGIESFKCSKEYILFFQLNLDPAFFPKKVYWINRMR